MVVPVALMTGRYIYRTPIWSSIMPLPVDADHFDRWLALFEQTPRRDICPPEAAAHFIERARRIAASLEVWHTLNGQGRTCSLVGELIS